MVKREIKNISLSKLFLDLKNPRHTPSGTEADAIEYLCDKEDVYPLARDIATNGLSPIEMFAVIPVAGNQGAYEVVEGNRRLCALKLLKDPELAPTKFKSQFKRLEKSFEGINSVRCVIFSDVDDASIWVERNHSGQNGGIGRKSWDADQKSRFIRDKQKNDKNKFALEFLDYSERESIIENGNRKGRLTTVQRYLSNSKIRELCFGLSLNDDDIVCTDRNKKTFNDLSKLFIEDLLSGVVNSRAKKAEIDKYADKLIHLETSDSPRILKWPLIDQAPKTPPAALDHSSGRKISKETSDDASTHDAGNSPTENQTDRTTEEGSKDKTDPDFERDNEVDSKNNGDHSGRHVRPSMQKYIQNHSNILDGLKKIKSKKLESLYCSLCNVSLYDNTPLLSVGCWAFLESLAALAGKGPNNDFISFWSKEKVKAYGFQEKETYNAFNQAVKRISEHGNTTKHHGTSANFYGHQLANDMEAIAPLVNACIEDIIKQSAEKKSG